MSQFTILKFFTIRLKIEDDLHLFEKTTKLKNVLKNRRFTIFERLLKIWFTVATFGLNIVASSIEGGAIQSTVGANRGLIRGSLYLHSNF